MDLTDEERAMQGAGDGLAEQPEGAPEAVGEEVELGEVGQRGIHCPDASKQGGEEEGDGGDGEDEGAAVGGGGGGRCCGGGNDEPGRGSRGEEGGGGRGSFPGEQGQGAA